MVKVNVYEAKTNFSKYLKRVAAGETIVICKHSVPVAELRLLEPEKKKPRPIGLGKGSVVLDERFWEPLPDDIQAAFEGRDD